MQVRDVMTENPACCSPHASIQEVARLMVDHDCGEIPVVDEQNRPIGVVTDRDICCRAVAEGKDASQTAVSEVMSNPAMTVELEDSLDDCCRRMEENQIRRVPVVDQAGSCCGMVAQADIARRAPEDETAEFLRDMSKPSGEAGRAGCC